MKRLVFAKLASAILVLFDSQISVASPTSSPIPQSQGEENERKLLKALAPILKSEGKVARIYYQVMCQPDFNYPAPFPSVGIRENSAGASGIRAIMRMFENDSLVSVSVSSPEIVRIEIGKISQSLLNTKISVLRLPMPEQYDPVSAIRAIEMTPEIQSAMRKYKSRGSSRVSNQLAPLPAPGAPHMPSLMRNVSMDQALDEVAKTFKGTVIYGSCSPQRMIDITFVGNALK